MLNIYLTRTPNIESSLDAGTSWVKGNGGSDKDNLHQFWKPFTEALIQYLVSKTNMETNYFGLILWGKIAEGITSCIAPQVAAETIDLYIWGHPSPLSTANKQNNNPKNFKYCDSFTKLNKSLEAHNRTLIEWGVKKTSTEVTELVPMPKKDNVSNRIIACTDGGCPKNGNKNAIASYGIYFPKTFENIENGIPARKIYGLVPKTLLELDNGKIVPHANGKSAAPTNNRGELLAFIHVFQEIIDADTVAPILIITDSELSMKTITTWMWNWYKVRKDFSHKKNPDLVAIIYKQLQDIKKLVPAKTLFAEDGLTIIHQNSHIKKGNIPKEGTRAWELYHGNQTADDLCNEVLTNSKKFSDYKTHKVLI